MRIHLPISALGILLVANAAAFAAAPPSKASSDHSSRATTAKATPPALDGQRFSGELHKKGSTAPANSETFTFQSGRLESKFFTDKGFQDPGYTETQSGKATHVQAVANSSDQGTMTLKGVLENKSFKATIEWKKPGQPGVEYLFRGEAAS